MEVHFWRFAPSHQDTLRANRTSGIEKHHPHTGPGLSGWHCSLEYLAGSTTYFSCFQGFCNRPLHSLPFSHWENAAGHTDSMYVHTSNSTWILLAIHKIIILSLSTFKMISSQSQLNQPNLPQLGSTASACRVSSSTTYARPLRTRPVGLERLVTQFFFFYFPCTTTTTDNLG